MSELGLREPLIFELSKPGRRAPSQFPPQIAAAVDLPDGDRGAAPGAAGAVWGFRRTCAA